MQNEATQGALPRRRLGRTSLWLTEVGLGTAGIGNLYAPLTDSTARATIDAAWQAGIRFFDTAPLYGFGLSERRLGDGLRGRPAAAFSIATKVGRLLQPLTEPVGPGGRQGFWSPMPFAAAYDYSYDGIMRSFEASLHRLGLARIDVLLVHDIGEMTHGAAHEEQRNHLRGSGYRALEELRASGTVKAIGLGVNESEACIDALDWGQFDCFLLAGRYTLLEQQPIERLLPMCVRAGASLIVGGVFNSGILATGTRGPGPHYYNYAPASEDIVAKVRRIERVCDAHGVPLAAAALQFPLAHPQVAAVIPGAANPAEIAAVLTNYRAAIPRSFWSALMSEGLVHPEAAVPNGSAPA